MSLPYKVLVLADSRGFAVDRFIAKLTRNRGDILQVEVLSYSGATIDQVVTWGIKEATYTSYDQAYILAGVNNLTTLQARKQVKPAFSDWSQLVRTMMIDLHIARTRLKRMTRYVIVCDLIAMNFELYNRDDRPYKPQQIILKAATMRINEYIHQMNYEAWVFSPRFADIIHKSRFPDKPIQHRYKATMKDGLHYKQETTEKFSIMLLSNIMNLRRDIGAYDTQDQ